MNARTINIIIPTLTILLFSPLLSAQTYYISSSTGDDTNNGISPSKPWKTFSNLSQIELAAGDSLLLKRNDVWNESLVIDDDGTSSKPITISAYGQGQRPSIQPKQMDVSCITVSSEGIEITSIDMGMARVGIEVLSANRMNKEYLRISDCSFHDIEDQYNSNPGLYNHFSNAILFSYYHPLKENTENDNNDRSVVFFRNVQITDCTIDNVNFGIHTGETFSTCNEEGFGTGKYCYMENVLFKNIKATNCAQMAFSFIFYKNARFINCDTHHCGYGVLKYGTCGGLIAYSENILFDGCDFIDSSRGSQPYDGVGFDFEGVTQNVIFRNAVIDGTDSAGIMVYDNINNAGNTNYLIENVTFKNVARNIGNTSGAIFFHQNKKTSSSGKVKNCTLFIEDTKRGIFTGDLSQVTFSNIIINPELSQCVRKTQ